MLTAKFAVSMRESSELAQVNRKEGSVEKMQKEIDALGGGSASERGQTRISADVMTRYDNMI